MQGLNGITDDMEAAQGAPGAHQNRRLRYIHIETYGCQMNVSDSELMAGVLKKAGYVVTPDLEEADVILLNTCAVREHAEQRVLGRLGQLAQLRVRKPHLVLGLCGCMAQHLREKLLRRIPYLNLVVGPDGYRRLPELIEQATEEAVIDVRLDRTEIYEDIAPVRADGVTAFVTIMRGCDKVCTFCIVPFVRGRERSLPPETILSEVRRLAESGIKEITYLGQTVNSYRYGDVDFAKLLRLTNEIDGIERIRFTSPHPSDMTDQAIEAMAACEKVCHHLHLPLQSASDPVLERMRRTYTVEQYRGLVRHLREAIPDLALTTDIIVGFPGETEADFRRTYEFVAETRYDSAFLFKYSSREGTRAYRWGDTLSEEEKTRRLEELIALQEKISAEINQGWVGQTPEVLIEGETKRDTNQWYGRISQFKTVVFSRNGEKPGDIVPVTIEKTTAHTLLGRT